MRPGGIAERDDRLRLAAEQRRRGVALLDAVRARDDAFVPRAEHHVLHAAADVERERLADDRDDERSLAHVLRRKDERRKLGLPLDDDELPLLRVARRTAQPAAIQD